MVRSMRSNRFSCESTSDSSGLKVYIVSKPDGPTSHAISATPGGAASWPRRRVARGPERNPRRTEECRELREDIAARPRRRPGGAGDRGVVLRRPAGKHEAVVESANGLDVKIADRKTALANGGAKRLDERSEVDVETAAPRLENEPGRRFETRDSAAAMIENCGRPRGHGKVSFSGPGNRRAATASCQSVRTTGRTDWREPGRSSRERKARVGTPDFAPSACLSARRCLVRGQRPPAILPRRRRTTRCA